MVFSNELILHFKPCLLSWQLLPVSVAEKRHRPDLCDTSCTKHDNNVQCKDCRYVTGTFCVIYVHSIP